MEDGNDGSFLMLHYIEFVKVTLHIKIATVTFINYSITVWNLGVVNK